MEHIYAVESTTQLRTYQTFASQIQTALDGFIAYLRSEFQVTELPRAVLWTNEKIATSLISDIPIPAYTNDYRIVMCPDPETWKRIYLKQLEGLPADTTGEIEAYYTHSLNQRHILQILGHELAHHSELFIDEAYESGTGIWFEEGMAEYISRRYFLSDNEFREEARLNRSLVTLYERHRATHDLQSFGQDTYRNDYAAIFYEYWRSFLTVEQIVNEYSGDLRAVFDSYHQWYKSGHHQSLSHWFEINKL